MINNINKKWLIFWLVGIAQFMVVLDASITNVALPSIKQTLHFSATNLQWVVTAYSLTFGGFLLLGGRTADLFGRKRVLLFGMSAFTLVSFLIGISSSSFLLIFLRAIQGLAAAFMSPSALSIVLTTFEEGKERNKALGFWTTIATGGAAMGLIVGGFLTQYIGWRWNFFINVPVGLFVAISILRILPPHEKEERSNRNLDLPGAAFITGGLMTLVYVISNAGNWGWLSTPTLFLLGVALALHIAFFIRESRYDHPLMPLSIFSSRNVVGANLMMAPIAGTMFSTFFLTSLYLQSVLHYSPFLTGLSFLPFPLILGITSTRTAQLVAKFGFKRFLIIGPLLTAIGLAFLARAPVHGNYIPDILPTMLIMPIGLGLTFMPIILAATSGIASHKAGLASGLINTSQQMGGALGLAVLASIAAYTTASETNVDLISALVHGYHQAYIAAVFFLLFAISVAHFVIVQPKEINTSQKTIERLAMTD